MNTIQPGMTVRACNSNVVRHLQCPKAVVVEIDKYQVVVRPLKGPYTQKEFYYGLKTFWQYFQEET